MCELLCSVLHIDKSNIESFYSWMAHASKNSFFIHLYPHKTFLYIRIVFNLRLISETPEINYLKNDITFVIYCFPLKHNVISNR